MPVPQMFNPVTVNDPLNAVFTKFTRMLAVLLPEMMVAPVWTVQL